MKKTILMALAVMLTVVLLLPGAAFADNALQIKLEDQTAGETGSVSIPIQIESNPGVSYLSLKIDYPAEAFESVSVSNGALFDGFTQGQNYVWDSAADVTATGVLGTITMTLKPGAMQPGATYRVTLVIQECWNGNEEAVMTSVTAANIKIPVPEHAHDWDEGTVTTPATCTEDGVKTFHCKQTGCTETRTEAVEPIGHAWGEGVVTTEPGCETKGVRTYTCGNDASHTKTEDIDPVGHAWGEGVVTTEPGCETKGVRTYTCGNDASHTKTEDIDPVGHAWGEGEVTTAAGCETKGVRTYTCGSDASHTKTEDIDPVGHAWGEGVVTTEPGCETKGVRTYTCGSDASHTKTEDIDPVGHAWDEGEVTTEPGCETKGVRSYTCGSDASHTKTEDIDPLGHDWNEGEETKAATTTEKGEMLYTCRRDAAHTKTEEIPVLLPATPAPAASAPAGDEIAKTGDHAQPVLWLMLALVTGTAAAGILMARRKKEN